MCSKQWALLQQQAREMKMAKARAQKKGSEGERYGSVVCSLLQCSISFSRMLRFWEGGDRGEDWQVYWLVSGHNKAHLQRDLERLLRLRHISSTDIHRSLGK